MISAVADAAAPRSPGAASTSSAARRAAIQTARRAEFVNESSADAASACPGRCRLWRCFCGCRPPAAQNLDDRGVRKLLVRIVQRFGRFANLLGVPGLVREGEYRSSSLGVVVSVKRSGLYTVVSVDGVDVYFYRFSGRIDGVGISRGADYKSAATRGSARSAAAFADRMDIARSRTS